MRSHTGLQAYIASQYSLFCRTNLASAQGCNWRRGGRGQIHRRHSLLGPKNDSSGSGEGHDNQSFESDIPHNELPIELQGLFFMHLSFMHKESGAVSYAKEHDVQDKP